MSISIVSATTLHTQFFCENGGGVYDRIKDFCNNISIILWTNRYNYHKYCLNFNYSFLFVNVFMFKIVNHRIVYLTRDARLRDTRQVPEPV